MNTNKYFINPKETGERGKGTKNRWVKTRTKGKY